MESAHVALRQSSPLRRLFILALGAVLATVFPARASRRESERARERETESHRDRESAGERGARERRYRTIGIKPGGEMETMMVSDAIKDPAAVVGPHKRNRIQVSTNKKPLYFYVNLAKRYMQYHNEIELSALGMAIGTVVTVAEILKNNGLATEKSNQKHSHLLSYFL
ncbi:Uncharacterized protein AXF42_Ash014343 [Apostasia shenzhenica]|uniref:DNA/RNA-binding protein Alba-like domain-containing protein n=1 Tax=Apostasia shenzhenica TaxID=1088818 RepID=A0A2I0B0V6_9ASPA|nr:Uncharacterized protein AXF42_Ash014343 [Apostasia shenzhenica]